MAQIMKYRQCADYTILDEMRRDSNIFMYSIRGYYDVLRGVSRDEWPSLMDEFGWERICHTGICEYGFSGAAVGAALAGARPVCVVRSEFLADAAGQLFVQAGNMRFKLGEKRDCPVCFRIDLNGRGASTVHHAGLYLNWGAGTPCMFIAVPSTAADVRGLWRTALRTTKDPVVMYEDKTLGSLEMPVPEGDYTIPFGVADVKREGSDVTIAAIGGWVHVALAVAEDLAKEGIDAEVWDPRTLIPFDRESLVKSVMKTGAMVVIGQDPKTFGCTGEFAMTVAEAMTPVPPMARVATMDVPIGAAPPLADYVYPNEDKIMSAVKEVLGRKAGGAGGMDFSGPGGVGKDL